MIVAPTESATSQERLDAGWTPGGWAAGPAWGIRQTVVAVSRPEPMSQLPELDRNLSYSIKERLPALVRFAALSENSIPQ
jgi:hypothetical protein